MRAFLSYASEQRLIADRIAVGLRQAGAEVFFDRDALPAGEGYDAAIRAQVERSDLFIFLVSPDALAPGTYALTELGLARARWPNPSGHVLPVTVVPLAGQEIPPYLAAVGILTPAGNVTAEVLASVAKLAGRRRRRRLLLGAVGVSACGALAAAVAAIPHPEPKPGPTTTCALAADLRPDGPAPGDRPESPRLVVTTARSSDAFPLSAAGHASFEAPVAAGEAWTLELVDLQGVAFGKVELSGCPAAAAERKVGHGLVLSVQHRETAPP